MPLQTRGLPPPKRPLIPLALATVLLATAPASAAADERATLDRALAIVKGHHLLSAPDLACSTLVYTGTEAGVGSVTVAEKHGGRCRGDPDTAPARFHLEIDARSGRVLWDNNDDREMRPIP